MDLDRRRFLAGAAALGTVGLAGRPAWARGTVAAGVYPGAWAEAIGGVVAPALEQAHGVRLEIQPLYAVDQIARAWAGRGRPLLDVFLLDPGPRLNGVESGLFEPLVPGNLPNLGSWPGDLIDAWGVAVATQLVGIAYNPARLPAPRGWDDLLRDPWVSRLGLTGLHTTFATAAVIEIARRFDGSETNVDPFFAEMRHARAKVAVVDTPQAMAALYRQGRCDVFYATDRTVAALKGRGVDIAFVKPESGAVAFRTTLHVARGAPQMENAYRYIDTVIGAGVQAALARPPWNFPPVPPADATAGLVRHDWARINPLRAGWIERFNREVAA